AQQTPTNETARLTRGFSQLYLALGGAEGANAIAVRAYWKPLILLIWLGCAVMALGGMLSLADKRLRIGIPTRARAPRPARAAAWGARGAGCRGGAPACPWPPPRGAGPWSGTRCCPIRPRTPAPAMPRRNCAASCASPSRSAILTRR